MEPKTEGGGGRSYGVVGAAAPPVALTLTLTLAVLLVAFGVLVGEAAAISDHRVRIQEDGSARVTSTFELYSDADGKRYNYWDTSVRLMDDARVVSVEDSQGEIDDYTLRDGVLEFRTNTAVAREKEVVTVEYVVGDATVEGPPEGTGVDIVELRFTGLRDVRDDVPDEATQARVTADAPILSTSPAPGFDVEMSDSGSEALYSGNGTALVRVAVGRPDERYDSLGLFVGDGVGTEPSLSEADRMYPTVPRALGFKPPVNIHPVVVLRDDAYEERAPGWSEGQYTSGGVILVRESVFEKEGSDPTTTVLHEVTHAYNRWAFSWSDTIVSWFDEGTAEYTEFLVRMRRGDVPREIFGEDRRWYDNETDRVISAPSRLSPEDLRRYYEEGDGFMRTWDVEEDGDVREFGYVFSELAVREYVVRNGPLALHETYATLLGRESRVEGYDRATGVVLDAMGREDLRPCAPDSPEGLEGCLESVNGMDAVIPGYGGTRSETVEFEEIRLPEAEDVRDASEGTGDGGANGDGEGGGILGRIMDLITAIADFIRGLFGLSGATTVGSFG